MLKNTIITAILIAILGCNSNKKNNEREKLETKDNIISNQVNPTNIITEQDSIKFVYVKLKFLLKIYKKNPDTEELILNKEENKVYSSQILKIDDLTEDKKTQLMDSIAESIKGNNGNIIERRCLVFDSYSEASNDRFKNQDKF